MMETTFFHSNTPSVYRVRLGNTSYDELFATYKGILKDACTSAVKSAMIDYITENVEPVGWMAVWRPLQRLNLSIDYDFTVEVKYVSLHDLQAEIKIMNVINYLDMAANDSEDKNCLENMLNQDNYMVSIIELYPLSEGDGEEKFLKTAVAIEYVRFFYKYVWRPWDDDNDDVFFAEKHLKPRLKFYFDIKKKIIVETTAERANEILNEGWEIKHKLEELEQTLDCSNSESELSEDDMAEILQLRLKLEDIQRQMEMLENPLIRTIVAKKDVSFISLPEERWSYNGTVHHVVAECFTLNLISSLPIDLTSVLEFHHNLSSAVARASSGDKIFILPGHYKCGNLGWLEENITIEGIGNTGRIILESVDNGAVFVNCAASDVSLRNLVFKSKSNIMSSIVVHNGHLKLTDCSIESFRAKNCLVIVKGGNATLKNCKLWNAKQHGIQISSDTSLTMNSCTVSDCGRSGLKIEGDDAVEAHSTYLCLSECTIRGNGDYGIVVSSMTANAPILNDENRNEIDVLESICWLNTKIEKLDIYDNVQGKVGLHSSTQSCLDFELDGDSSQSSDVITKVQWMDSSNESVFD